jgi:hypothetical protein
LPDNINLKDKTKKKAETPKNNIEAVPVKDE